MKTVWWSSPIPTRCDICNEELTNVFYDAKTKMGPWVCMCTTCQTLGPGLNLLGLGKGQKYEKQSSGRFLKTAG